ncbi:MAG: hypothetical protein ABSE73_03100 [Planctomycetota bacterium]
MATNAEAPPQVVCPHCQRQMDHVLCCYLNTKELNRPPAPSADAKEKTKFHLLSYAPLYACPHCRTVLGVLGSFAHNVSNIEHMNIMKPPIPP